MHLGGLSSWGVAWKELGNEPPFNGLRLAFQGRAGGKNRAHKWTASSSSENTTKITRSNCVGHKRHDPNRWDYTSLLSKKKNKTHLFGFVRV